MLFYRRLQVAMSKGWLPRGVWAYGNSICDGMFTYETTYLRQENVIQHGREACHHLTVSVVGPPGVGKTSLIRKLTGILTGCDIMAESQYYALRLILYVE